MGLYRKSMKLNSHYLLNNQVMKKTIALTMAAFSLMLTACNKNAFSSQLGFEVSSVSTRAIWNQGGDISFTWEEGDLIALKVEVVPDMGKTGKKMTDQVEGKLVYEKGKWVTYMAEGSFFSNVEFIPVRSSTLDCKVKTTFSFRSGISADWTQTVPFTEGRQTILVMFPFGNTMSY